MYVCILFIYTQYAFLFIAACVLSVLFVHWSYMRQSQKFSRGMDSEIILFVWSGGWGGGGDGGSKA